MTDLFFANLETIGVTIGASIIACAALTYLHKCSRINSFEEGISLGLEEGEHKGLERGIIIGYEFRQMMIEREAFPDGIPEDNK